MVQDLYSSCWDLVMAVSKCILHLNVFINLLNLYPRDMSTVITNNVQTIGKYSIESWGPLNQTVSQKDWWLMTRDGRPKRGGEETGLGDGPSQDDRIAVP